MRIILSGSEEQARVLAFLAFNIDRCSIVGGQLTCAVVP